jgi:hypothetical protein
LVSLKLLSIKDLSGELTSSSRRFGTQACPVLIFQLQSLDNLPILSLFLQKETLFTGILIFLLPFLHYQGKLLNNYCCFPIDLDGSVSTGVANSIKGFEIPLDPPLKPIKVFFLILISFGDAGEVEREVSFLEGLLSPIQNLIDFFFLGNLAGEKKKKGEQKGEEVSSHFSFSISPPGCTFAFPRPL